MKKLLLLVFMISGIFTSVVSAQRKEILTVHTRFAGVLEGYDHLCKTIVYVDGKMVCETSVQSQSRPNSCTVSIPRGTHNLRIVNMANYEGKWEEHTVKNEYTINALYESEIKIKKGFTINLVFDISKEKTIASLN